jgi:hypothetical protein
LYGIRSDLSHGNKQAVLEQDLVDLRFFARILIYKMIKKVNTFNRHSEFLQWIEDEKLKG